jgi:pyrroloquinoline quinone biosynthesis protein B
VRAKKPGTVARSHASLAVSAGGKAWTLINASPDVRLQIESFPALHPGPGLRETPLQNILLTDAELDHTIGLLILREGTAIDVYGTAAVLGALTEIFPLKPLLQHYAPIRWHEIRPQTTFLLEDSRLRLKAVAVGSKRPRFATNCNPDVGWVVGYRIEDVKTGGVAIYAPAIESWTPELAAELSGADCALVDGTFWTDGEMIDAGVGELTARAMGHLPISGPEGSAERLASLRLKQTVYVHINNTNPVLDHSSPERRFLAEKGIEIGWDGMDVEV